MYCIKCGKENEEKARFCCGCGLVFEDLETQSTQPPIPPVYSQPNYYQPPQTQFNTNPQYQNQNQYQYQNTQYQQNIPPQYYNQQYFQYGQPMMEGQQMYRQPLPAYGLSIASMVLGIISIVLFLGFYISIPCAIVGIVLGCIAHSKAKAIGLKNSFATAGIICSVVAIALVAIVFILAITSIISGDISGNIQY